MRLYILGLNNPQGRAPLDPSVVGSTGYRLLELVSAEGVTTEQWLAGTQRVNLLEPGALPRDYRRRAAARGDYLAGLIRRRAVVLLGSDVASALGHEAPPFEWRGSWVQIPHPSGKNRWYNDPVHRAAVGIFLADALRLQGE